jgi:beta-galactosidase
MRDVVLEGTEKIYPWAGDRYPAKDTFTSVVDLDDIAPFCKSEKYAHGWAQMTNGLTSADSWKFIFYHDLGKADPRPKWSAALPQEEEVVRFSIVLNVHYHIIRKMRLLFDDDPATAIDLDLKPGAELRQDFAIPNRKCKRITLEPLAWDEVGKQPVIGVDNIWIQVKRGDDYRDRVVPLLNVGALVRYRMGKGGVVLNQLLIQSSEPNPVNAQKKQTIVATLLRNLGATFAAGRSLVGAEMRYVPVPLEEKCTAYLTGDRGWLQGAPDLGHLPVGEQRFGAVPYVIRDFRTSPLPACVMLAGPGAKGALPKAVEDIPIGRRADVLFFLHTFHQVKDWQPPREKDRDQRPPVVFKYVVRYADGQSVEVPVRLGRGVGHWISERPSGLPEASVAWAAPFPREPGRQAVVYQMAWTNPRPGVVIKSLDVRYDAAVGDQYGVPALLGVTAATAAQ